MKKLVLSLFVVIVAMSFNSAKAQNATGNASDNGVPLTSPPPQTTTTTTTTTAAGVNAVNNVVSIPVAGPVVAITPLTAQAGQVTQAALDAAPAVPATPAAPVAPTGGSQGTGSTFNTTLNLPVAAVPVTAPFTALPDISVPVPN